ncbi:G patch domain-containing protein 4 [Xenentodon cancila]
MAEAEKSRGLKFAEQQLRRHGWERGKGLGRAENGMVEAIKVKVKCDKGGVGHKEGEQFTFHWWDHVFNKASASLQVDSDQNGIMLKKTAEEDEDDGLISNKKPRKAALAKAKLYGCFVKSATLLSGQEQPEPKSDSSADDTSSSSDEEEDQRLDLSSTTKLSDADLMKVCGGRTAHKGARHGLTMSAKLARLEQQEAEFMAKFGLKTQAAASPAACVAPSSGSEPREEFTERRCRLKKKRKSSNKSAGSSGGDRSESPETQLQPKKKRKKQKADEVEVTEGDRTCPADEERCQKAKRSRKKRKNIVGQDGGAPSPAEGTPEETDELHCNTKVKKKKKKNKVPEPAQEESRKSSRTNSEDGEVVPATERRKRKKSKKDKVLIDNDAGEEARPPKKKKKKKCKD